MKVSELSSKQIYNIQLAGKLVAQHRYREFDALHTNVRGS